MGTNLNIKIEESEKDQSYQVVIFIGEFDKAGHTEIKQELDKIIENFEKKTLVFDFKALDFINSEGIGYLMEIHAHLMNRDRKLVIVGVKSNVSDVFKTIGLGEIVSVYDNLKDFLNQ